jgi:RND family efflux transporter MFP subunit
MSQERIPDLEALRISGEQRQRGGRGRTLVVGAVLVVLVAAVLAVVLLAREGQVEVSVVNAAPVETGASVAVLDASGYVTPRRRATVAAKITGRVTEVLVDEGMAVAEGQVLARLDDADARARYRATVAEREVARATQTDLEVNLVNAERSLRRTVELHEDGVASQGSLDDATTRVDSLRAQLELAKQQLEAAESQVAVAAQDLDNYTIRAPFAGIAVSKDAQPGEMVSPISAGGGYTRTGIGTIVDMDSLEIEVDVNEAYINRVRPGQPVQAVLDAYPQWQIPAAVIAIIPTADRSKATVKVRVAIKEKDPRILPDMGVRVSFLDDAPKGQEQAARGVLVPATALVERDGASVAFVVVGDRAQRRAVTPGPVQGELRLVETGIAAGERVVSDPPGSLADGMRVRTPGS